MSSDVVFLSVEASGDDLAADVIAELRRRVPDISVSGVGGPGLSKVGLKSPIDLTPMIIVGFMEGLLNYHKVIGLADATAEFIVAENPKAVVLIDAWGFTWRVAQRIRKANPEIKLIKLIGPQVWATRKGRAKTLSEFFDYLLCIHDFEIPFYQDYDIQTTVIGNPALSRMKDGDGNAFRERHNIPENKEILLVLPGSRPSEIKRVAPTLANSASIIAQRRAEKLDVYVLVSPNIKENIEAADLNWPENTYFIHDVEEKADLMSAATFALACSGTVTTELATQHCPMIVGYRLGPISWWIAKSGVFRAKYVTLVNVAADELIAPELLQHELNEEKVVALSEQYLDSPEKRRSQIDRLDHAVRLMGWGRTPAHVVSAEKILDIIGMK